MVRFLIVVHRLACTPDLVTIKLRKWKIPSNRTRRDDHLVSGNGFCRLANLNRRRRELFVEFAITDLNFYLGSRFDNLRVRVEELDLVLLHQVLNTLVELVRNIPRSSNHLVPVELHLASADAPFFLLSELFHKFCVRDQCL